MTILTSARESPGQAALLALAVLTGVEYVIGGRDITGAFAMLTLIAVVKAAVIVIAFMHLANVLRGSADD